MIDDLSKVALPGDHASDWSLAIHSNALGWSPVWSLVYVFDCGTPSQGCLEKSLPGKVKQLQAIDQTSDWSLAIHFISGKVGHLY